MALTDKLIAVADEIRGKTNLTGGLSLEQMAQDVAAMPAFPVDVPAYVQTEAERVAKAVKALQNDNTLSFVALSDTHIGSSSYDASVTHAMQAAHIIERLVPIDFAVHLGDHVTGASSDSPTTHLGNLMESLRVEAIASPALRLVGNHDANSYNAASYLSAEDTNGYIGRYARSVVKPSAEPERGYFYMDIESKKTRVICLNTADQKGIAQANTVDGHFVSAAQLAWLVSVLDMTGKSGWRIIVLSHHPIHWYNSMTNVLTVLDAYVAGSSGSVTSGGTAVSYNFSGKNAAKLVATFHGHTHNLIHGKAGTAEIIRMGTPNGCYGRNNEYGSASSYPDPQYTEFRAKYGETTTYSKTSGSAKDTAFCVYTIDFAAEAVYATCYGAGYDRVMSYSDVVYYFITNNLSNVTTSNTAASIEGGSAYSATLTVPGGYTLDNITVKMGGVDVTSSVYSNGKITIANVTGDVVITASAKKEPVSFVVDVNAVGYTDSARWSTSSGDIRTGVTGMTAINIANFERSVGQTATVEFSGINWTQSTNCAIVYYRNGAYVGAHQFDGKAHTYPDMGLQFVVGSNGAMTVIFTDPTDATYAGINGFKCCGYGNGANAVIKITVE